MTGITFPPRVAFPLVCNRDSITYLDNAATTQKPQVVLDALNDFYRNHNANVHRSAHRLSNESTTMFESARQTVADFVHASSSSEIVWTRGTTESINLVAQSFAPLVLNQDSAVLITELEHHSNIVPWQLACEKSGAKLKVARVNRDGILDLEHFHQLLDRNVKIVAVGHVSNALGIINPIKKIISSAHEVGARVLIDGAQAAAHVPIDVQDLDCDFYTFSSHKVYGPTGIGVLYGKHELLESMPPWQGGGEMIERVSFEKTTYQPPPLRFEAGTPDISGPIGLAVAIQYFESCVNSGVHEYENELLQYANSSLQQIEGLKIVGDSRDKVPIVSFLIEGTHPNDIATLLDEQNVAVRAGHHCAMPLMNALNISGTVRASLALYNSKEDIDSMVRAVHTACRIHGI